MSPQVAAIGRRQLICLMNGMRTDQEIRNEMKSRSTGPSIGSKKTASLDGGFWSYRIEVDMQVAQKSDEVPRIGEEARNLGHNHVTHHQLACTASA
jgi:hypothetical protein